MTRPGLVLLTLSAVCSVSSNVLIKYGVNRAGGFAPTLQRILALLTQPWFFFGAVLYGLGALLWFRVLSTEQLSVSYPVLISFTFTLLTLAAILFLGERFSWQKMLGLVVIGVGILVTARA